MGSDPCHEIERNKKYPKYSYALNSELAVFSTRCSERLRLYADPKSLTGPHQSGLRKLGSETLDRLQALPKQGTKFDDRRFSIWLLPAIRGKTQPPSTCGFSSL